MHAARMQSTNVEFMGTKCLQRIWKRPSTACRGLGDACIRLAGMRTKGEEIDTSVRSVIGETATYVVAHDDLE